VVFGEYIEVEDELSHQHCCSAFLFFAFLHVVVVLSFVAPIVVYVLRNFYKGSKLRCDDKIQKIRAIVSWACRKLWNYAFVGVTCKKLEPIGWVILLKFRT